MPIKAVQQFMLGTVMNKEAQAVETMRKMKANRSFTLISNLRFGISGLGEYCHV